MSAAPVIVIDTLALPGASVADGARIAAVVQAELGRLWEGDRAAGRSWRDAIDAVMLDCDPAAPPARTGAAIARAVRRAALREDGA
jgi:hypothetical protein